MISLQLMGDGGRLVLGRSAAEPVIWATKRDHASVTTPYRSTEGGIARNRRRWKLASAVCSSNAQLTKVLLVNNLNRGPAGRRLMSAGMGGGGKHNFKNYLR